MKGQTSKGFRITLLIYAIYMIVYGLAHVITPESLGAVDPAIERVLGAAAIAFGFGAGLAYFERNWSQVRIVVLTQIVWMALNTITMAWGILAGAITTAAWPPTIIAFVFFVLLLVLYLREERVNK